MTFDPQKHMTKLKGKDYLEAKWRLVWLRDEHPDAIIETQHIDLDLERNHAIFRATVTIPGGGSATGYGSESSKDFGDFIEKAETKALARALAALGYGTQFTGDELAEGERIVDSPVQRQQRPAPGPTAAALVETDRNKVSARYFAVVNAKGLTDDERKILQRIAYGVESSKDLTIPQIQQLIERIESRSVNDLRDAVQRQLDLDKAVVLPSELIAH
jgi:hypothetical protein